MFVRINEDNSVTILHDLDSSEIAKLMNINDTITDDTVMVTEFGDVYPKSAKFKVVDSLPESKYGYYKYNPTTDTIEVDTDKELTRAKTEQIKHIKQAFYQFRQTTGRMLSAVLGGVMVDAREKEAINLQLLCDVYADDDTVQLEYRLHDNSFINITGAQLHQLKKELAHFGLALYQYKWSLENNISQAVTIDDVVSYVFDEDYVVKELSPYQSTT